MGSTPIDKQVSEILRGVAEILPSEEELAARLKKRGKLRVKLGIDPTHTDLTLGHTVVLEKLRTFQELGHDVIYIIGDFTALVGDPSGRKKARPQLTEEQIRQYAATFREQAGKILDMDKAEVRYNSEWLAKLSMKDCIELCSQMTVARMLEREDFGERYRSETPIYIHEFLYALLQAYDSVAVKPDIEIGATEQKFNLLMGRQLMQHKGLQPQLVLTMPILIGTDGVMKMSKSEGNYIALTDTPQDMFGKVMSIPDGIITHYFRLLTQKGEDEIAAMEKAMAEGANPMDFKLDLAEEITKKFHSIGKQERDRFIAAFSEGDKEAIAGRISVPPRLIKDGKVDIVRLLVEIGAVKSGNEARRLIAQGAVKIDGKKVNPEDTQLKVLGGELLEIGKKKAYRVAVSE
ncbi:MAG: tyrosine--tRNA ligase [Planctomycetales bacterium 4484_113]|nr:MAG: tyrosine--tRNA ligase [Planctomycetales bacterium 4484_113]